MKLATDLVVLGALFGAAVMLDARHRTPRQHQLPPVPPIGPDEPDFAGSPAGPGVTPDTGSADVPPLQGIADVDPQPLTQVSAEAIDPDATRAAHEVIIEQRERLPMRGKNIP
jgi:hypothetical protein